MTKKTNQVPSFITEPIAAGAIVIFGAIGSLNPFVGIGALATTGFSYWQNKNFRKFRDEIEKKFKAVDQEKIDQDFLYSDEFKALVVQGVEAAIRSSSDERCEALANAILSSATLPTSKLNNKQMILRVLAQMTDEEILVLKALYSYEKTLAPNRKKPTDVISTEQISQEVGRDVEETSITCDGLTQLGLAYDAEGQYFDSTGQHREIWRITSLGKRVVDYALKKD